LTLCDDACKPAVARALQVARKQEARVFLFAGSDRALPVDVGICVKTDDPLLLPCVAQTFGHLLGRVTRLYLKLSLAQGADVDDDPAEFLIRKDLAQRRFLGLQEDP
jgi:hypothetical protein